MPVLTSFRRLTDPLQIPVGPQSQRFDVVRGFIPPGAESFWVVNPNPFWVRLRGSGTNSIDGNSMSGEYIDVMAEDGRGLGWHWPPGFIGVFGTQYPRFLSTVSTSAQGLTPGSGFIELAWGNGS